MPLITQLPPQQPHLLNGQVDAHFTKPLSLSRNVPSTPSYSMVQETETALARTLQLAKSQIPPEIKALAAEVTFSAKDGTAPYFPTPFKETEAIASLKAIEAATAAALGNLRFGKQERKINVDLEKASCFLFSTYVATIGGYGKQDKESKKLIKDTDLLKAQSVLYRRLSANLYETKRPGEYYHIHGSLEASTTLNMLGLEAHRPDLTGYEECIEVIEDKVRNFTTEELEELNRKNKQAGVPALTYEQFLATPHGQSMLQQAPWTLKTLEQDSAPAAWPTSSNTLSGKPQPLAGIKVLELCRVIAGPSMGRGLAEYGADVIKVTAPYLSDVPFFQVDGNLGKHTTDIDLRSDKGREIFEELLADTDVVLDGYREGALERLGYGPKQLAEKFKSRNKGFVYVAENCFGFGGDWSYRPGWQQIADCVTGVAWAQGKFMGLNEPVVPPFPMSDYGTGVQGTIAALMGLFKRAKYGGSYHAVTSIVQYDMLLMQLGLYSESMQEELRKTHDPEFFNLRHFDSVDEVGRRSLQTMRRTHPQLFESRLFVEAFSQGYNANIKYLKPVVEIEGLRNGFNRSSRPNGADQPTWAGWEVEDVKEAK